MTQEDEPRVLQGFVRGFLQAIEAGVREEEGVLVVQPPAGRKRRFGRERRISFDEAHRGPHVEIMEPGSPLLKQMVEDAQSGFGGIGVIYDENRPAGTIVYTFQLTMFTALKKRTSFWHVLWGSAYDEPVAYEGLPDFVMESGPEADPGVFDESAVREGLDSIRATVRQVADEFARPGMEEAERMYKKNAGRIREYFDNLRQEQHQEEARLRKRLGEIQSKLYFTEDGLREIKLEKERDRLTKHLRELKQKQAEGTQHLDGGEQDQLERQRRRYAPKLAVHLVGVTVLTDRAAAAQASVGSTLSPNGD